MTPAHHSRTITRATGVGIVTILIALTWMGTVEGMLPTSQPKPPTVRPFSDRMGCPPWTEGLSRSVTIIATEDEHGMLRSMQCVRTKDRGIARRGL